MDILGTILQAKGGDLLSSLTGSGFTQEQAGKFLPEAGNSLLSILGDKGGDQDADSILGQLDIASLASKVGIDSSLAETGLKQIIPIIMSQLGGGDLGNIMGKMKSLF